MYLSLGACLFRRRGCIQLASSSFPLGAEKFVRARRLFAVILSYVEIASVIIAAQLVPLTTAEDRLVVPWKVQIERVRNAPCKHSLNKAVHTYKFYFCMCAQVVKRLAIVRYPFSTNFRQMRNNTTPLATPTPAALLCAILDLSPHPNTGAL